MPLLADTETSSALRRNSDIRVPLTVNHPYQPTGRTKYPVFSQSAREWTSQEILSSTGSQSMARRSCMQILCYFSPSKHVTLVRNEAIRYNYGGGGEKCQGKGHIFSALSGLKPIECRGDRYRSSLMGGAGAPLRNIITLSLTRL